MSVDDVLALGDQAIVVALKIGAPVMLLALACGLLISILQALTQIQEMTLTFVPKILLIMVSLMVLLPFMVATLVDFTRMLAGHIVNG
ncbi:MAG TPA: flagellar biosynthesis protein FliQ [Stellaceae bacterium]|nr:flagellar biosynthesis protein FliQ [Stellaceae bacterium]